jgi:hypothetical protein
VCASSDSVGAAARDFHGKLRIAPTDATARDALE